jgi:hypothetical protein
VVSAAVPSNIPVVVWARTALEKGVHSSSKRQGTRSGHLRLGIRWSPYR